MAKAIMKPVIHTIGHSDHAVAVLVELLQKHGVTALCDVRSRPYSRLHSQFNREVLQIMLREDGIHYVFLGKELGARSEDASCYIGGKVQYDRLARTDLFRQGITRLKEGLKTHRIALMCAERDPLECHRTILVARELEAEGITVRHIMGDGEVETHAQAMARLLGKLKLPEYDMFRTREEILAEAYAMQGERIAYEEVRTDDEAEGVKAAYK